VDYITVQLERERAIKLLKLSISKYLDEIGNLLSYSNRENEPELAKKICQLAQAALRDAELLHKVKYSAPSQES